jgi:hypothetical protein
MMRAPMALRLVLTTLLATFLAGCPAKEIECRTGADCASGACRADGTCAAASPDGGGAVDGGDVSDGGAADGGNSDGGPVDSGTPLTCSPNHDGTITRVEMPVGAGLHATFRIGGPSAAVSTLGTAQADGGREWKLDTAFAADRSVLVETTSLEGAWFQADFPGASYTSKLSDTSTLLGVFEATADALLLRGIVSPTSTYPSTKLVYSPPAKLIAFPLTHGSTFTTTSTVSGTYSGMPGYSYSETYVSNSDQVGDAVTPFARFPVQRVAVVVSRSSLTYTRQFLFVTECFGTVATMTSAQYEAAAEFTSASEVRRLAQ